MQLFKSPAFLYADKFQICMTECGVGCHNLSTLTAARQPGWVILSEDNGSLLPMSVSAIQLLAGLTTFCISAKCKRQHRKLGLVFFKVVIIYSFKPVPASSSERVDNRLPTQEGKQTSQESASTSESQRSNQNQALVVNIGCHGWGPSSRIQKVVLLSVGLA